MTKDVILYDTVDGGEISDDIETRYPIDSAAYLSLFGGNAQDDGSANNSATWWGNLLESDPNYKQVSKTQYALANLALAPMNIHKFKAAALSDLNWITSLGYGKTLDVSVTIPGVNKIKIIVSVDGVEILEHFATPEPEEDRVSPYVVPPPWNFEYDVETYLITGNASTPTVTLKIYDTAKELIRTEVLPVSAGAFSFDASEYLQGPYYASVFATDDLGGISVSLPYIPFERLVPMQYNGAWRYDGAQNYDGYLN